MAGREGRVYRFDDFSLDVAEQRLKRANQETHLPPKTFATLLYLVERHGHLIKKNELLDSVWGDTAVAENTLTQRIREVREALSDDAQNPRYIKTIPRVGYKFIAEVEEVGTGSDQRSPSVENEFPVTEEERAVVPSQSRLLWGKRASLSVGVLTLLIVLAAGGLYLLRGRGRVIESLAVLPFTNLSADAEQDYFAEGMTEALIADLARIGALRVISRNSVMQYQRGRKPMTQIGRELKADALVEGSVARLGERVRITVRLIDTATNRYLWTGSYERELRDISVLERDVSRAIAREIKIGMTAPEPSSLVSAAPVDPAAYEAYLKGRYFWNKRTDAGFKKGIEYFEEAIRKQPDYALAYVGLADCYNLLNRRETFRRAKEAATKALAMDSTLAEAHASLAFAKTFYDWDWFGAEREFKRSIELNPNYAVAHHWYGLHLMMTARLDESLSELKRAQELEPLSLIINTHVGWAYYFERRYDEAIAAYRRTLEMDPNFSAALLRLGSAYEQAGMYEEAIATFQKALNLPDGDPSDLALLAHAYLVSGRRAEGLTIIAELKELSKRGHLNPCVIASTYAELGEKDRALEWLEKGYEERNGWLTLLNVDPKLDRLRPEPRFQDLIRRVGLPVVRNNSVP